MQYWRKTNSDLTMGLPPVPVRPASSTEPRTYLAEPSFSTCTIPVVYYQHNAFNFAHTFRDNAAKFYSALQESPGLAQHIKILLMTGGGLAPSRMNRALWQPISNLSVESLAEFSVRLPDEQVGEYPLPPPELPPTYEGTQQRCFQDMLVCPRDLATNTWQLHAYGQSLVQHYGGAALVRRVKAAHPPKQQTAPLQLPPPVSLIAQQAGTDAGNATAERLLRIVFQKRVDDGRHNATDRQIVNTVELVEACNRWRYVSQAGVRFKALCWEVELTSLEVGIAAAQLADVFVGVHGANIANQWLMRPGSSAIELTTHEFDENFAHINLAKRNMEDAATRVQCWKVLLCDPEASWTPGWAEAEAIASGAPSQDFFAKYRNVVVGWEALSTVLRDVVDTAGDMDAYRQRWRDGRWWWLSTANQTTYAGPDKHMTCKLAKQKGLIA